MAQGALLADDAATRQAAAHLAQAWLSMDSSSSAYTVHLEGDLGAGKTTSVQAFLREVGVTGRVRSPSFTLAETYVVRWESRTLRLNHFDCYRFSEASEWQDAGFDDLLLEADVNFIEWPSKAAPHLPAPDLLIKLSVVPHETESLLDARKLQAQAFTHRGELWLKRAANI